MFFPTWPCGILLKWFTRASVKMESEVENRFWGRSLPVQGWRCLRVWLGWVHRAAESTDLCEVYYCRSEYLKLKTRPPSLHNCFYIQLHCTCYIFSCSFHSCIPVIFFVEERWHVLGHVIIFEKFNDLKCNISRLQGHSCVHVFFPSSFPPFSLSRPLCKSIVSKELKRSARTLGSSGNAVGGKALLGTQA